MRYYKGKYLIALYDYENDDEFIGVYDNVRELSNELKLPIDSVRTTISKISKGKVRYFRCDNVKCKVYFIDVTEEEENES